MYGPEEKAKLERLINEGSTVLREIEDLKEGLKESVKAVAEELEIKPSVINKAITIAHKDCLLYTSPSPRDGLLSRMPSSA